MSTNHRYNRSEGCCICATKNSTSQFRPWYEHYSEEKYCEVFRLKSLDGRRGHVCNPCVLYIKRVSKNMTNGSLTMDPTKRLDSKLKGNTRPIIPDIFPPDSTGSPSQSSAGRELGYCARNMRLQPKYVFTGKPYIKLRSFHQLIPAGSWQDPSMFLEDEDNAEKDAHIYRRVTLKRGVKTLEEKAREKQKKEEEEENELFGEIVDKPMKKKKCRNGRHCMARAKPPPDRSSKASGPKMYATRAHVAQDKTSARKADLEEEDGWETVEDVELSGHESDVTDTGDEITGGDLPDMDREKSPNSKRASPCPEVSDTSIPEEMQFSTVHCETGASQGNENHSKELQNSANPPFRHDQQQPKRFNRRVMRKPVKNFRRPKVSFFDPSYWQKFILCCVTVYVGEGRMCVLQPREDVKECPFQKQKLLQQQQSQSTSSFVEGDTVSDVASSSKETVADQESEVASLVSSGDDELNENRINFTSSPLVDPALMHKPIACSDPGLDDQIKRHLNDYMQENTNSQASAALAFSL